MTEMLSASGGFAPLTRCSAAGPRWGLYPQTPVIGSCSARAMVPPQPLTPFAVYAATVMAGGIQYSDLSPVNLRTFWRNASSTRYVSCQTLKQWNNNLPKFHFRLKEEMFDYYHDIQYLIQGRGSASYTS